MASARLRGGQPHFVAAGIDPDRRPAPDIDAIPVDWIELDGRPVGVTLAERWADLRATWARTTFFLFDPESWR
jgi:hypothetical protein